MRVEWCRYPGNEEMCISPNCGVVAISLPLVLVSEEVKQEMKLDSKPIFLEVKVREEHGTG